jgi:hypothetical protein
VIKIAIRPSTSRAELAALVCKLLTEDLGDHPVLVGGSVVSIYTEGRYVSDDLDIVTYRDNRHIRPLMEKHGFVKHGAHWTHPATDLLVQFVSPPAMVGEKYVKTPARMRTSVGDLPVFSPLDSACDRLAWFLSGDSESIEQCADIVATQKVPLRDVQRWLENEHWPVRDKERALVLLKKKVKLRRSPK